MERHFDLTMRLLDNGKFEIDLYDNESGDCVQLSCDEDIFDKHGEFDAAIGAELQSWAEIMLEEREEMIVAAI